MNKNQIYLEKRLKVLVPGSTIKTHNLPAGRGLTNGDVLVATISKNIESLGYTFSHDLFTKLSRLTREQLSDFYKEIVPILKKMRGAHRQFAPMYPNFPQQVLDMSEFELYMNAMTHYWSFWLQDAGVIENTWLPKYEKEERLPAPEFSRLDVIDLGDCEDFENIFTTLVSARSSISESDKEIVEEFIKNFPIKDKGPILRLLPDQIPMKEQLALVAGLMLKYTEYAGVLSKYVKTATDVLRVAVAFSGGDVSLAKNTKFVNFKRSERKFLLGLLENCSNSVEDMVRHQDKWIRLGERLHPTEYKNRFPKAASAFDIIRNHKHIETFNSKVEFNLKNDNVEKAVELLIQRPGDFARRLDHIFRSDVSNRTIFSHIFLSVADKVSTNVLLQLYNHFKTRSETTFHPVFPKGNLAKIHVLDEERDVISPVFCNTFARNIREVLVKRFSALGKLGNVYLDPKLKNFIVPFSQRSASKALKTIVRGSKIALDGDYDTIRFFIWWKNLDKPEKNAYGYTNTRVDIDLTGCILDENWNHKTHIAYYNLKDFEGHHSGDITDAPNGASEFIDISLSKVLESGGRYVVMCVNSFTQTPYCNLPECFAGWMGRSEPNSGEIYEPKLVKNKVDLAADSTFGIPLIIDAKERKVIWCDLSLKQSPLWNNARNNSNNISLVCKAMAELKKPNLYDLLSMHVEGRGKKVENKSKAKVVFSSETTPFEIDEIITKYL